MVLKAARKLPCFILTLYLVIAVTGAFVFSAVEALHFFENKGKLVNSDGFFSSISRAIDCLAENTVTIDRANRHSSTSLRSGCLRTIVLSNIQNAGTYFAGSSLQTANEYYVPIPKDVILIKLRI